MISSAKIQREYNRLYKEIRKYIWDFEAVEALADLEIEVYKLCPDIPTVRDRLNNLKYYTNPLVLDDKDLDKAIHRFEDLINSDDTPYSKLWSVKEVVQ